MKPPNDRSAPRPPQDLPQRKPGAFALEEAAAPRKAREKPRETLRKPTAFSAGVELTAIEDDPFLAPLTASGDTECGDIARPRPRRPFSAGKVFAASLGLLVSLAVGLWMESLIRNLFDRLPWLGWLAAAAAFAAVAALLALAVREYRGLRRLTVVAGLRGEIAAAGKAVSAREARKLASQVAAIVGTRPETARGRKSLADLEGEIVDGSDYIAFAERELLETLDRRARELILAATRRVSVVTALSPRALVDVAYVAFEAYRLVRSIAGLYGGHPGSLGMMRLFRDVVAHLAVTGTVALSDSLVQQLVGHGIAARLSARLGEGVVNGMMTARIGISAMDLCRPMPFSALKRPGMGEFVAAIPRMTGEPGSGGNR